ncbi:MAG: hypothetical protein RL497_446 [Pseudomonadota bacterium]
MLRYPSTKQILTVAVISALLAGCGKDSKKAETADSNIMDKPPVVVRPEVNDPNFKLGEPLQLTEVSDVARQGQAIGIAAVVMMTTLNADTGSTAVKQAMSAFSGLTPSNTATGALVEIGHQTSSCNQGGDFVLTLAMGEGKDTPQTGAFNHEEVYFDSVFNNCSLSGTQIDGSLGMSLTLGLAELINSASFRIETKVVADGLKVKQGGSDFYADGEAGYKFYTNNGYELNNEFYADQFRVDAGNTVNLVNFSLHQTNNTSTNGWTLKVKGTYEEAVNKTYVLVETPANAPLKGKGYGYPNGGKISVLTKQPDPNLPKSGAIDISVKQTLDTITYPPDGTYVFIEIYNAAGTVDTSIGLPWGDLEEIATSAAAGKSFAQIQEDLKSGGGGGGGGDGDGGGGNDN